MITRASCRARVVALVFLTTAAEAQQIPEDHILWSAKPTIAEFEAAEDHRLAEAQRTIGAIAAVKGARTIANTLVPYDDAIRQLDTAANLALLMQQVHPDAAFRDRATAMTTKTGSAQTSLNLNTTVYQALASLDVDRADPATRYYVQHQLLEFRLAGVDRDAVTREKLRTLNARLLNDLSLFDRNITDDPRFIKITQRSELDGLPDDYVDRYKPGADGLIRISVDEPDFPTVMTYAKNDDVRRRFWEAFNTRGYPKNREVLTDILQVRYEIATLMGYSSWADYYAADNMMGNGRNISILLEQLDAAARPIAEREVAMLLAEKRKTSPTAEEVFGYEYYRLAEMVRRSHYGFDSQAVRPYLAYERVKQGIMDTAAALFHLNFMKEASAIAWDPSVEIWDVRENAKMIGRFYLDMHPRSGKYAHGQTSPLLDGVRGKQLPEAALVCNFPEPTAIDPGLMEYDDVVTFFHEFGHLMHHILGGQVRWAGVSGMNVARDFVETPGLMLEEWLQSPQVLASFAHHYKTGELMPADLISRLNRASAFGRAVNRVGTETAYAAISYDVHKANPSTIRLDTTTLSDLRRHGILIPVASEGHMYANFNGLVGYSSAYYTYLWDRVIAEDFLQSFNHENLLAGDAAMRYRRLVLEPGGSMSAYDLVTRFLGRAPNMTAFQRWIAEEF